MERKSHTEMGRPCLRPADDLIEGWIDWLRAGGAGDGTCDLRRKTIRLLCGHAGTTDPLTITSRQIVAWLADCRAPNTRATYRTGAASFYAWAVAEQLLERDPMARVPKARTPRSMPQPVSWRLLADVLDHPVSARTNAYVILAAFAGLRVFEIAKIHGRDIDLHNGVLYVNGKGGVQSAIPMHPRVERLTQGMPSSSYWFPGRGRPHVHARSVSAAIRRALLSVGAPSNAHAHQLRHTYGTELMTRTGDLRVVQELMRHASPSTTAGYTQVANRAKRMAIESLPDRERIA
jgi:integrase/recombinase XerD